MARPARGPRKTAGLSQPFTIPEGFEIADELSYKPPENEDDRRHRLKRDVWSFWVKEASASLIAVVALLILCGFCAVALFHPRATPGDRQWAMDRLSQLLVGVVGFLFGKVTK